MGHAAYHQRGEGSAKKRSRRSRRRWRDSRSPKARRTIGEEDGAGARIVEKKRMTKLDATSPIPVHPGDILGDADEQSITKIAACTSLKMGTARINEILRRRARPIGAGWR